MAPGRSRRRSNTRRARCATASAATPSPRTRSARCAGRPRRDPAQLCVVETPADLLTMEQTHAYAGLYFVLMGRLSPLDGIGPREIRLDRLLKRATDGEVREVILATNFTNEGRGDGAHHRRDADRARPQGHASRARRPGRRRARVRRRRHARAGAARAPRPRLTLRSARCVPPRGRSIDASKESAAPAGDGYRPPVQRRIRRAPVQGGRRRVRAYNRKSLPGAGRILPGTGKGNGTIPTSPAPARGRAAAITTSEDS